MDINNLKAFIEVADKKSFSRSAESLKLTQPAVSKRIAALESELSARLFDRVGRSIHLTEAGRLLLPSARQINSELSRIEDVICNLDKHVSGTLSIGSCEYIGTHHLPEVLEPYQQNYPNVDIKLRFASSLEVMQDVEDGHVELALCSRPANFHLSPKLQSANIWSDKVVVVAADNHPLVTGPRASKISLEELSKHRSILPPRSTSIRLALDDIMQAGNVTASVCVEAKEFETIKKMAVIGLGWTCLPKYLVDDESLTVLPVEEIDITYSIALIKHHERTLSRAAEAFVDSLPTAAKATEPFSQQYELDNDPPQDSAPDLEGSGQSKLTPS